MQVEIHNKSYLNLKYNPYNLRFEHYILSFKPNLKFEFQHIFEECHLIIQKLSFIKIGLVFYKTYQSVTEA